ncbi:hypothetical protein M408DRAFT_19334 [Serendipita vermifera MAFF 305830]|uniref:Uncharacterized protein n=1 Tax=Serendipita vermifera MAFF 305830 TaxID=933852 RepID=A0A0C3BC68_SERVB|nr:hypothetical protein M408DRAFT_19334 [Serendipita vermifera MAFF 305830]
MLAPSLNIGLFPAYPWTLSSAFPDSQSTVLRSLYLLVLLFTFQRTTQLEAARSTTQTNQPAKTKPKRLLKSLTMQATRIITALCFAAFAIAAPLPAPGFPVPATTTDATATATGGDASANCWGWCNVPWKQ